MYLILKALQDSSLQFSGSLGDKVKFEANGKILMFDVAILNW